MTVSAVYGLLSSGFWSLEFSRGASVLVVRNSGR